MKNGLIYFLSCMAIEKVIAFGVILNFELKVDCCYCYDHYQVYVKHNFIYNQPSKIMCFLYSFDDVAQCYVSKINGNGSRNLQRQMQEKVHVKSTNRQTYAVAYEIKSIIWGNNNGILCSIIIPKECVVRTLNTLSIQKGLLLFVKYHTTTISTQWKVVAFKVTPLAYFISYNYYLCCHPMIENYYFVSSLY